MVIDSETWHWTDHHLHLNITDQLKLPGEHLKKSGSIWISSSVFGLNSSWTCFGYVDYTSLPSKQCFRFQVLTFATVCDSMTLTTGDINQISCPQLLGEEHWRWQTPISTDHRQWSDTWKTTRQHPSINHPSIIHPSSIHPSIHHPFYLLLCSLVVFPWALCLYICNLSTSGPGDMLPAV